MDNISLQEDPGSYAAQSSVHTLNTKKFNDTPRDVIPLKGISKFPTPCRVCAFRNDCEAARLLSLENIHSNSSLLRTRLVRRNEYLFKQGEPAGSVYGVRSGSLKRFLSPLDSDEYISSFYLPGSTLVADAMDSRMAHTSSTIALEDSSVCVLSLERLNGTSKYKNDWNRWFLKLGSREIAKRRQTLLWITNLNAKSRLISFLLSVSKDHKQDCNSEQVFNLSMSRGDIGNHLGLTS